MESEEVGLCFPHLLNSSCRRAQSHSPEAVLIYTVLFLLSLLTATLNLLVIVSIAHFRQLHSATNLILLSLAVSDFFIGLVVVPVETFMWKSCWLFGDLLCLLYFLLPITLIISSIISVVLISVDRYVAICHPMHYHTRITMKRVQVTVCVSWVYSFFFAVGILHENYYNLGAYKSCHGECLITIAVAADLVLGFFIPISIIVIMYLLVFVVAVSQARAMRSKVATVTFHSTQSKKSEIKAARNLGILVLVYLMCYSPYCVVLAGQPILVGMSLEVIMIFVMYVNSCLNPLIYALFYPWFRKATKIIVTLEILKPGSRDFKII
ncbi:trace amine-associated receptor 4-like [Boleophthalmus pectinirostris]|uniref:trace amine-associated receptor 4-like n=1 Tax=Boleophthalmus pectinirostris TaxID=150288 RepID=UPI0024329022|nr:trace amine-associated receptor 4-like [Boleophthalmus pectinirostris]